MGIPNRVPSLQNLRPPNEMVSHNHKKIGDNLIEVQNI